ncbi:MAG: DUF368 domain-containing protein [Crocinitomicaceae bacterium]
MQSKKRFFGLLVRGMGMGAADVVPGVSGGTIAFITGIYEELLETISGINFGLIKTWRKEGFKAMWKALNGNFLLALLLGIVIAIFSLAQLLEYLLANHTIVLWAFFFGLILASIWLVGKTVENWNYRSVLGVIFGTVLAYVITIMTPAEGTDNLLYIFLCGSLAICAMILPGISGSFILLLLGAYTTILGSVSGLLDALKAKQWEIVTDNGLTLLVFMAGCLFGLITFSKLLNFLFKKSKSFIIAVLTGFLIGSLNKVWPWKMTTKSIIDRHGELKPVVQENILPQDFTLMTDSPNHLVYAVLAAFSGLALVILIEYLGRRFKKDSPPA